MNSRHYLSTIGLGFLLCGVLLGRTTPAAGALVYPHGFTFENHTGQTATDLHILIFPPAARPYNDIGKDFGSPTFATVVIDPPATPVNLTFSGSDPTRPGMVPDGGSATVFWFSNSANDNLVVSGEWSTAEGNFRFGAQTVALDVRENADNTVTVSVDNLTGGAVSYSGLQAFTGADNAFFTAPDFLAHASSGTPVSLLIPDSGTLPSGDTAFAMFTPSPSGYSAWSVVIDGLQISGGRGEVTVVPEPGSLTTALIGSVCSLALWLCCRKARRRVPAPAA